MFSLTRSPCRRINLSISSSVKTDVSKDKMVRPPIQALHSPSAVRPTYCLQRSPQARQMRKAHIFVQKVKGNFDALRHNIVRQLLPSPSMSPATENFDRGLEQTRSVKNDLLPTEMRSPLSSPQQLVSCPSTHSHSPFTAWDVLLLASVPNMTPFLTYKEWISCI